MNTSKLEFFSIMLLLILVYLLHLHQHWYTFVIYSNVCDLQIISKQRGIVKHYTGSGNNSAGKCFSSTQSGHSNTSQNSCRCSAVGGVPICSDSHCCAHSDPGDCWHCLHLYIMVQVNWWKQFNNYIIAIMVAICTSELV